MPSRQELNARARVVGLTPASYPNDSKLEQVILYREKRATAITGTVGTTTMTMGATGPSDAETFTIGSKVYTFKSTLTEVYATCKLTVSDAPHDGDTITIDNIVYTFNTSIGGAYSVLIGTAAQSLDYLLMAVNAAGGTEGTEWGTGTVANPRVVATTNSNTEQTFSARIPGTAGNRISIQENMNHATLAGNQLGATLAGVDPVANEVLIGASVAATLDNVKLAVNAGAVTFGAQEYSHGTTAHPDVTAEANAATTQVFESIGFSYTNDIATTETATDTAFTSTVMASGTPKVVADAAAGTRSMEGGFHGAKNV